MLLASCELPYAIGIRLVKGNNVKQVTVICIILIFVWCLAKYTGGKEYMEDTAQNVKGIDDSIESIRDEIQELEYMKSVVERDY